MVFVRPESLAESVHSMVKLLGALHTAWVFGFNHAQFCLQSPTDGLL